MYASVSECICMHLYLNVYVCIRIYIRDKKQMGLEGAGISTYYSDGISKDKIQLVQVFFFFSLFFCFFFSFSCSFRGEIAVLSLMLSRSFCFVWGLVLVLYIHDTYIDTYKRKHQNSSKAHTKKKCCQKNKKNAFLLSRSFGFVRGFV